MIAIYIERKVNFIPNLLFSIFSLMSDIAFEWIVLPKANAIIEETEKKSKLLKYRIKVSKIINGVVSQKLACALIALSSFLSLKPIVTLVSRLNLTTLTNSV